MTGLTHSRANELSQSKSKDVLWPGESTTTEGGRSCERTVVRRRRSFGLVSGVAHDWVSGNAPGTQTGTTSEP